MQQLAIQQSVALLEDLRVKASELRLFLFFLLNQTLRDPHSPTNVRFTCAEQRVPKCWQPGGY